MTWRFCTKGGRLNPVLHQNVPDWTKILAQRSQSRPSNINFYDQVLIPKAIPLIKRGGNAIRRLGKGTGSLQWGLTWYAESAARLRRLLHHLPLADPCTWTYKLRQMWVSTWWTVVVSLFAHVFALIMGDVGGQIIIAQSSNFTSHTWCWWADCTWCWWAAAAVGRHASSLEA